MTNIILVTLISSIFDPIKLGILSYLEYGGTADSLIRVFCTSMQCATSTGASAQIQIAGYSNKVITT